MLEFLLRENITTRAQDISRADPFEEFRLWALAFTACLFKEAADLLDGGKGRATVTDMWRDQICQQGQPAHAARASRDAMLARAIARARARLPAASPTEWEDDYSSLATRSSAR